ncbi:MAG: bifunctional riboflavin kinase/FAD synthetase [Anaerolineae bacterium]|nr:bifunctional riboflavin kinase/FAD synthetase [Caldilineales bacterium]MCX7852204.1 bifunctional riboflavin kinase/FAD synthetase [Caldilineales bacterium]MDW8268583.1 bifunctional riboflavin kinase/FAD synthetase [Anaerolineae bacterium]
MQLYESLTSASLTGPTFLTIGNFDGLHRGHRALIAAMCAAARTEGATCGLVTFYPHPRTVLRPDQPVSCLSSLDERLALFAETGLDFVVVHPFTQATAQTEAEDFLHLLHAHLGLRRLWVGPDFALGRGRKGTTAFLAAQGAGMGIQVEVVPEFAWEGQVIRSSRIRRLVEMGHVEWAATWLGRFYGLTGLVVRGSRRGHSIGFPTANLAVAAGRVIPANGVYATWAWVEGRRYMAVTNVGLRPTVNGTHRTVEAHVMDFDGDLYGRSLRLEFVARLRDEMRFPGLDALRAQIARDRDRAAALLAREPVVPAEPRFEEVPHTADWAIRVRGKTQAELYANAAMAMAILQGAADVDGPTVTTFVEVEGIDRETLLVNWLNRLLWEAETQQLTPSSFWIESISDERLTALVTGRRGRSEMAHIKAVTFSGLEVTPPARDGDDWRAQVVFDT